LSKAYGQPEFLVFCAIAPENLAAHRTVPLLLEFPSLATVPEQMQPSRTIEFVASTVTKDWQASFSTRQTTCCDERDKQ
jgi:hypothetical protein